MRLLLIEAATFLLIVCTAADLSLSPLPFRLTGCYDLSSLDLTETHENVAPDASLTPSSYVLPLNINDTCSFPLQRVALDSDSTGETNTTESPYKSKRARNSRPIHMPMGKGSIGQPEGCPTGQKTLKCDDCGGGVTQGNGLFRCQGIEENGFQWKDCICRRTKNLHSDPLVRDLTTEEIRSHMERAYRLTKGDANQEPNERSALDGVDAPGEVAKKNEDSENDDKKDAGEAEDGDKSRKIQ